MFCSLFFFFFRLCCAIWRGSFGRFQTRLATAWSMCASVSVKRPPGGQTGIKGVQMWQRALTSTASPPPPTLGPFSPPLRENAARTYHRWHAVSAPFKDIQQTPWKLSCHFLSSLHSQTRTVASRKKQKTIIVITSKIKAIDECFRLSPKLLFARR